MSLTYHVVVPFGPGRSGSSTPGEADQRRQHRIASQTDPEPSRPEAIRTALKEWLTGWRRLR